MLLFLYPGKQLLPLRDSYSASERSNWEATQFSSDDVISLIMEKHTVKSSLYLLFLFFRLKIQQNGSLNNYQYFVKRKPNFVFSFI